MENIDKSTPRKWRFLLKTEKMFQQLPLLYLTAILAVVYIASVHSADRKLRAISSLKQDVQETRWLYMSEKAELMKNTTLSKIEGRVKSIHMNSGGQPPVIVR